MVPVDKGVTRGINNMGELPSLDEQNVVEYYR